MTVPGGKGANQAVAASRLGRNVSIIGCVSSDFFGENLIKNLIANNVNAGEIFFGALAVAISQGKRIDEAIDFGNIVGTLAVGKKGAKTSISTLKNLENFIKKGGI